MLQTDIQITVYKIPESTLSSGSITSTKWPILVYQWTFYNAWNSIPTAVPLPHNTLHFKTKIKYKSWLQLNQARTSAYKSYSRVANTCETLGSQPKTSGKDIEQHVTSTRQKYTDDYVHNDCLKIVQSASTYTDTSILIWQTILDMQPPATTEPVAARVARAAPRSKNRT